MSPRAKPPMQALNPLVAYAARSTAINAANLYAPDIVPSKPMMSALNPTVIAYIADMVSRQVYQQEKVAEVTPTWPCLIPHDLIPWHSP